MKKFIAVLFLLSTLLAFTVLSDQSPLERVSRLVASGHWQEAEPAIAAALQNGNLDFSTRQGLLFQRERMKRMALDFNKNRDQVLAEMQRIVPGEVTATMLDKWEKAGSVEYLIVDGSKRYFSEAAANVFRVNAEARALKKRRAPPPPLATTWLAMRENIIEIIRQHDRKGETLCAPRRFRVEYTLTVKADAVPAGETLRAWLPYPQEGGRQKDVRLLESDPASCWIAPESLPQRSVYMEKTAVAKEPTRFRIIFQYTSSGFFLTLDDKKVRPIDPRNPEISPFLGERPPHIVFTPELRSLSRQIIGNEKNPLAQARLIFVWMNGHVPWAAAREYSTIDNISEYARLNCWGDCGIQTLLFITLCRLNGIPARWESGWTTGSNWNMHDWSQIYLEPNGWIPVDVAYGLMPSSDPRQRFFYFGNIDSQRLVVNRDFSRPLYPAKVFFRSETVDFQRGEVEWVGGNLYFDQWDWQYQVKLASF